MFCDDLNLVGVYSGLELLRDPRYNKGLAFCEEERARHYLQGLLPPVVMSQELQVSFGYFLVLYVLIEDP